jgi:murein DD-endopeptidase MepM/ murein hydrolase activator NlpD
VKPETPPRSELRRQARAFTIGAACGFVAGAFVLSAIVWQYGNVIGSRSASVQHPARPAAATDRWGSPPADADFPILEADTPPAVPARDGGAVPPAPSGEAVISPPASSPGELADRDLVIPVEGISAGELVRSYEDERSGSRLHKAIDILAPTGTPVKAVEDGTIARLFYSKAGGITIYQFDPSERFCYYYAHLDRYAEGIKEGDRVRKGQVVGYVGVSGNAPKNTPHLHFAVFRLTDAKRWWEGTPIDPYDILR